MESSFLGTSMPQGVLGSLSRRVPGQMVEPVETKGANIKFGFPIVLDTEGVGVGITSATATLKPADVYGICLRQFPVRQTETGDPDTKLTQSCLRSGYVYMQKAATDVTAIKMGMPVFLVVKTAGTHKVLGEVVGAADGTNTIQLDATFMGDADQNGRIEVAWRI